MNENLPSGSKRTPRRTSRRLAMPCLRAACGRRPARCAPAGPARSGTPSRTTTAAVPLIDPPQPRPAELPVGDDHDPERNVPTANTPVSRKSSWVTPCCTRSPNASAGSARTATSRPARLADAPHDQPQEPARRPTGDLHQGATHAWKRTSAATSDPSIRRTNPSRPHCTAGLEAGVEGDHQGTARRLRAAARTPTPPGRGRPPRRWPGSSVAVEHGQALDTASVTGHGAAASRRRG